MMASGNSTATICYRKWRVRHETHATFNFMSTSPSWDYLLKTKTYRNSPEGNCIAFQWVFQVCHHTLSNKAVKGLYQVQTKIYCRKNHQNQPIMHMKLGHLCSMSSYRVRTQLNLRHFWLKRKGRHYKLIEGRREGDGGILTNIIRIDSTATKSNAFLQDADICVVKNQSNFSSNEESSCSINRFRSHLIY